MRVCMALLLVTAAFAGCLGDEAEQPPRDAPAPLSGPRPAASDDPADRSATPPAEPASPRITTTTALTGFAGAEPSIGITSTGTLFATAHDRVIRSTDGGATWTPVYAFGLESFGLPVDPITNNDPMLWVDPADDRVYNAPMWPALACVQLSWSDDEGASWTERPMQCNQLPNMDHQWLSGGPRGPWDNPFDLRGHDTVLYLCYNTGLGPPQVNCAVSYDGGTTFPVVSVVHEGECLDASGRPVVAPDGTAIVVAGKGCDTPHVGISIDGGQTWATVALPGNTGLEGSDPRAALDDGGTLYVVWTDADFQPRMAHARLEAALDPDAWTVRSLDAAGVTSAAFPTIVAGAPGRATVALIGTTMAEGDPSLAPDDARWHLHVVVFEDADGPSPMVTALRATPDEDPVQIGCIWLRGIVVSEEQPVPEISECRNLLDFIDAVAGPDGRPWVAYTDGCTVGCANRADAHAADSRGAAVAWASVEGIHLR